MSRSLIIIYVTVAIFLVLLIRIYNLSIKSNTYYDELANNNIIRSESIVPIRGQILDRNGLPLAVNELGFAISIKPHLRGKNLQKLEDILIELSDYFENIDINETKKEYIKKDSPYNHEYITIIEFIPHKDMQKIYPKLLQHQDIKIIPSTKRYYPNNDLASHLIGYIGKANQKESDENEVARLSKRIGKNGIEKEYNDFLSGELGFRKIKITAFNEELEIVEESPPKENNDIYLSIDTRLQLALNHTFKDISGAAIVMDIDNGEILAAGSYPEYDVNLFVDGISTTAWQDLLSNPHHPLNNKLISGLYPPGSVVKMGVGLSFMKSGISPNETVFCNGGFEFGNRNFRCWKKDGHGSVNLSEAIKHSCDVYFYKQSLAAGIDNIADTLSTLGLGKRTGIDLPNEFYGVIPSSEWKKRKYKKSWYMGETLISAIGQGYTLVTPMQIAVYTAALASGKIVTPKLNLLKETLKTDVPKEYLQGIDIVRGAMVKVCNEPGGTAYWRLYDNPVKVACKTGTAQVVGIAQDVEEREKEEDMDYWHRSHAWLTTYLPADNPRYVITVMVEHGGHGGSAGAPIVKELTNAMINLGYLQKDNKK